MVWATHERLGVLLDEAGHLTAAPELVVEVLSPGTENDRRDKDLKLRLYSTRGVQEYSIAVRPRDDESRKGTRTKRVDWKLQQVEVYRRQEGKLSLALTLFVTDTITSPLLPNFSCAVGEFFE